MMRRNCTLLAAAALAACARGSGDAAARWDDAGSREARAQVERTMDAFAARDLGGFTAGLAPDVVGFEVDLDGKPVRLGSRDEAARFAGSTFAALAKMGAALRLDRHATSCRADASLAWCTVEFDARATMPDGSSMVQPTRNTVVLRRDGGAWKWAEWHSSPAVAPPAPAATPPAPGSAAG
jgi:ketosteroid isomerase-like protein